MIAGIGIDVVEISRMQRAVDEWGETFLRKIFTPDELAYAHARKNPTPHIAARFAVKEAVAKALATGWSGGFRWKDVEVENDSSGKPTVALYGRAKELLQAHVKQIVYLHEWTPSDVDPKMDSQKKAEYKKVTARLDTRQICIADPRAEWAVSALRKKSQLRRAHRTR